LSKLGAKQTKAQQEPGGTLKKTVAKIKGKIKTKPKKPLVLNF
jgi:hypothetical protein